MPSITITPIVASHFATDGGALFGLVPKPIWSRGLPANERNAVPQRANVCLLEWPDGRRGLLDSGCGDPAWFSEKEQRLQAMPPGWPLLQALRDLTIEPDTIDFVALTHLHWDHAGGIGRILEGQLQLTFPQADYFVHAQEWHDACSGNPLLYKSYPADVLAPLQAVANQRLRLIESDRTTIAPGLTMHRSGGHTRGHCAFELQGEPMHLQHPAADAFGPCIKAVYAGDVCLTAHHLRLVFQTAYDTFPLDTRAWKQQWLPRIADEGMVLLFGHDPDRFAAHIAADPRQEFVVTQSL